MAGTLAAVRQIQHLGEEWEATSTGAASGAAFGNAVSLTSHARVSTSDQTCENQLLELRRYCEARHWQPTEYVDAGISGAKDRGGNTLRLINPAL